MEKPKETVWSNYIEQTKKYPPSPLLVGAMKDVREKQRALDLGAGQLKDTKYLLEQDFLHVDVVDSEPVVADLVGELRDERVKVFVTTFDAFDFKEGAYDVVNAQYTLPFTPPETFEKVMNGIKQSLKSEGIFTGQFFGSHDEWNVPGKNMSFHTLEEARAYFSDMKLIAFDEVERDARTADGNPKHWHVFNIIAKKI